MNDKVEEYKNSASVLMSVATESICWLVAAFSFVIMWCISIALEPVRKLTRCCSDRPSRSTDHAATTSILRLVAAFSNASKFSRPLAPLTPLSAYSTTICHPRRAHPLNTRAPARARGEQAERWAEGLGIISGGVLLRSPAAAKAAALPTRTKSLSSQLHQTLLMEIISIRMRKIVRRTLSPTTCLWLSSGCHQMLGSKPIYFRSMLICPIGIGTARGLPGANHVGSVR